MVMATSGMATHPGGRHIRGGVRSVMAIHLAMATHPAMATSYPVMGDGSGSLPRIFLPLARVYGGSKVAMPVTGKLSVSGTAERLPLFLG